MPELPEVTTVVDDLNRKVRGQKIIRVWFDFPKMIKDVLSQKRNVVSLKAVRRFSKDLIGEKILRAERRGKNILVYLSHDKLLLIHQKMTGHLLIGKWLVRGQMSDVNCRAIPLSPPAMVNDPYNKYIHLIFYLDDGRQLALSDLRKFAKVILGTADQIENLPELKSLGLDASSPELTFDKFYELIRRRGQTIKQTLMDQDRIAGIGNIYSDDILWQARVHPRRHPIKLTRTELKKIYSAMRAVLTKAVRLRGTSTSDFRDTAGKEGGYTDYRLVYGREGEPCQRCQTPIKRITIGARSAHFCPNCQ